AKVQISGLSLTGLASMARWLVEQWCCRCCRLVLNDLHFIIIKLSLRQTPLLPTNTPSRTHALNDKKHQATPALKAKSDCSVAATRSASNDASRAYSPQLAPLPGAAYS